MLCSTTRILFAAAIGTLPVLGGAKHASAQSYPIDCAILLCLSGGWPASVPCARARAEFIRRITPWPVEPPLQIWRCPMGASYHPNGDGGHRERLYDALFDGTPLPFSLPGSPPQRGADSTWTMQSLSPDRSRNLPKGLALHLVQNRADIDISGPEFNFVRSIRVYDVRYAQQQKNGRDGYCARIATVLLGTYGVQGDFTWAPTSPADLPEAHVGLERWGEDCPGIFHRSVFVDWRDYEGNYGYEQVNY